MAKRRGENPPVGSRGSRRYVPDAGQLIWLSFSPQAGREQSGRRPALFFRHARTILEPDSVSSAQSPRMSRIIHLRFCCPTAWPSLAWCSVTTSRAPTGNPAKRNTPSLLLLTYLLKCERNSDRYWGSK